MNKKISLKVFQLLSLLVITGFIGYYIGINRIQYEWSNYKPIISIQSKNPPKPQTLDMSLFYTVLDKVNESYYDKSKIDSQKMLYGAITGMLQSLDDPFTSFFPPPENTSFKNQLAGEFQGIGAELGMSPDNHIMVISPLDNSPAQNAGLKSGDIIVKVDGVDATTWTLSQAVDKIRGKKGTSVTLTVLHKNSKLPVDIKIVRNVITVNSTSGWVMNVQCTGNSCQPAPDTCKTCASVAYIRLSQFGDNTNSDWSKLVGTLFDQIKQEKRFKGIVLDLRNNPGGYLNDAVFIASEFLDSGVVVIQQDGTGQQLPMSVSRRGLLLNYPLVVLVNGGSASASEIVAGALRDHNRAKLIGEKTFGKGTVQEADDLPGGASVHVSVAKWLTPNQTWVNKKGLEPDITVAFDASKSAQVDPYEKTKFDNQLQTAVSTLLK